MIGILKIVLILSTVAAYYVPKFLVPSIKVSMASTSIKTPSQDNGFTELIKMILEALPMVLNTPTPEMNKEKLVVNPPVFTKHKTASQFRKAHKSEGAWRTQDIIDDFNQKYGVYRSPPIPATTAKVVDEKKALLDLLSELESMELTEELDAHIDKIPEINAERYIADATVTAFTRLDKTLNPERVVNNPKRFVKPMTLRDIKRKLDEDPEYFHH